jgi:hypothetical protein
LLCIDKPPAAFQVRTAATALLARASSCAAVADGDGRDISTTTAARPSVLVIWLIRRDSR